MSDRGRTASVIIAGGYGWGGHGAFIRFECFDYGMPLEGGGVSWP